jgi:hypothetical protein
VVLRRVVAAILLGWVFVTCGFAAPDATVATATPDLPQLPPSHLPPTEDYYEKVVITATRIG